MTQYLDNYGLTQNQRKHLTSDLKQQALIDHFNELLQIEPNNTRKKQSLKDMENIIDKELERIDIEISSKYPKK